MERHDPGLGPRECLIGQPGGAGSSRFRACRSRATLGEFDFVNVIEAPDTATVARVSIALGARGSTKIETLPALTIDELVATLT